ncbi:enoyl-CoA hydratase-related protein [Nocardia gamkensis]|uniref:enoyl-CoA hydratase-related protein n=1 Tax=Nocardia gamkensis TaxID=352869 RepID=UPI0036E6E10C
MACDIRVAADTAQFGLPETNQAIIPGAGGAQRLARLVGIGRAIELILTGRLVTRAEAAAMELVSQVVASDELVSDAREVALKILAQGPFAVRLAKLVIRTGMDADQRTGLVVQQLAQSLVYTSEDKREGVDAFSAKRPAAFDGK